MLHENTFKDLKLEKTIHRIQKVKKNKNNILAFVIFKMLCEKTKKG